MGKDLNVYQNDNALEDVKVKSELGRIKKMPHIELTEKDCEMLYLEYEKDRGFKRRRQGRWGVNDLRFRGEINNADVTSNKDLFAEFVAEKVDDWNMFIDRFNAGDKCGRYLCLELCDMRQIEQYKDLKGDLLKRDALLGDECAALDYAEFVDGKKEKEYYLNIAASKGYWTAIKRLVEGDYKSGEKYKSIYYQYTKLQTTNIVPDVESMKDVIKMLLANLGENQENAKEILPILLSLIGNTQNSDEFNFDSYLIHGRIGCGCALGKIEWKEIWAFEALTSALKLVGDYSNIKEFMEQSEFLELTNIVKERKSFDNYLFFAFRHSHGKLFGGGIPTAYESALKISALNERNNNLLTNK